MTLGKITKFCLLTSIWMFGLLLLEPDIGRSKDTESFCSSPGMGNNWVVKAYYTLGSSKC